MQYHLKPNECLGILNSQYSNPQMVMFIQNNDAPILILLHLIILLLQMAIILYQFHHLYKLIKLLYMSIHRKYTI